MRSPYVLRAPIGAGRYLQLLDEYDDCHHEQECRKCDRSEASEPPQRLDARVDRWIVTPREEVDQGGDCARCETTDQPPHERIVPARRSPCKRCLPAPERQPMRPRVWRALTSVDILTQCRRKVISLAEGSDAAHGRWLTMA